MSVRDIDDTPQGPFARRGGQWLCVFCESHIGNPAWFCERCGPHKRLTDDALEEPLNPHALEAERMLLAAMGDRAQGWENAAAGGRVRVQRAERKKGCTLWQRIHCVDCGWPQERCAKEEGD